jgi:hypothetical protein
MAINGRAGAGAARDHHELYRRHGPLHCRVMQRAAPPGNGQTSPSSSIGYFIVPM